MAATTGPSDSGGTRIRLGLGLKLRLGLGLEARAILISAYEKRRADYLWQQTTYGMTFLLLSSAIECILKCT